MIGEQKLQIYENTLSSKMDITMALVSQTPEHGICSYYVAVLIEVSGFVVIQMSE